MFITPKFSYFLIFFGIFICSCADKENEEVLFSLLNPKETGIFFNNELFFTEEYNPYTFKNFFNGGGVGIGDINNDGLMDIYFAGNLSENKLYLNKGNLKFEDITDKAGVSCKDVWSTGVTFVDINADGWMDIYICKSGRPGGDNRHNELFINNGNLTFTEKSKEYGLDFLGLSTHAVFFDYDRDGDLDCYLLNNSLRSVGGYDIVEGLRNVTDTLGGNRLLRNDRVSAHTGISSKDYKVRFYDVSKTAGIYGSAIGFGLGVSVSDINGDNWPDLYVSNDFFERDYLYINQQDGTFREVITDATSEISLGSMGADIADIDNDTRPDIFVTEMLPEKILRYKTKALFENWDKYNLNVSKGYHRQFGRNVLQINQGNIGTNNTVRFSEISRYCGVDATDWSWGALIADFNNDCQKDIFVANGIFKDLTDLDYVNFDFNPEAIQSMIRQKQNVIISMMEKVPSEAQQNYLYINKGNYTFENMAAATGLSKPTYSNGSAYCDLDNDGDLDLVINNINETAHIYRNNTLHSKDHSFLNVSLKGTFPNINAIGSKIICYSNDTTIMQELNPMRGFESCVDPRIHIGLGKISALDSISVIWPDGWRSVITNISLNSFVKISYDQIEKSSPKTEIFTRPETLLSPVSDGIGLKHIENEYSDFDRDRLLIYMVSNEGPPLAVKDLNKDGLEDIILGGSTGNATQIAYQKPNGRFSVSPLKASIPNAIMEDSDILIEDFDNDGLLDIYVSGGSSELPATSSGLKDRIYFGSTGGFIEKPAQFNSVYGATSAVVWMDMDDDGDKDIFAAGRLEPFNYGVPASSVVYENIAGHYTFSQTMSAPFRQFGMLNDAKSVDIDNDGKLDLILMRDMGNIEVVSIKAGRPIVRTAEFSMDKISGYWSSFEVVDINEDGYKDIIVCNKGLNNRIAAGYGSYELHVNDFDGNGQIEQLPCFAEGQNIFSWSMRDDLVKQLPGLKKKYLKYKDLASVGMKEMFDQQTLSKSVVYKINEFRSGVFKNVNGHFVFVPLPIQAQWTDQKAVLITDLNGDGRKDILMGGNQFKAKPETGIDAATFGSVFINEGDMNFSYCQNIKSGIFVPGEIRDIKLIMIKNKKHVIFARNNDEVVLYKLNI